MCRGLQMSDSNMKKNYVYIEVLRQVCPIEQYDDFDYFLLGGFDAMKIHLGDNIGALKKQYENGQSKTPSRFDRQPIFLYSDQNIDNIDTDKSIFRRVGEYGVRPLVVTLFQLDKAKVAQEKSINSPVKLINEFGRLIDEEMRIQNCSASQISYQVFWNLGESDITVAFRPTTLNILAKILHSFRTKNYSGSEPIQIISTCSHCAFPKPCGLKSTSDSEKEKELFYCLETWISNEFNNDNTSEFITLVNTSLKYNKVEPTTRFLFGEWDYMYQHKNDQAGKLIDFLQNIFCLLIKGNSTNNYLSPFRISYTIPVLSNIDINTEENSGGLNKKLPVHCNDEWIKELSDSMDRLCRETKNIFLNELRGEELAEVVTSFKCSILGLAKFLYRLKIGRFEEDLYAYVQPVFVRLKAITDNYTNNIGSLNFEQDKKQIDKLIKEYISNTSELIESLQHLFSIMAVSPHTFMETYGSNMRSLSASDKLLDAYQGIINFLKNNFPDVISGEKTERDILVLPYRKAQSAHTLLYQQSSPRNRISYIQIDFTKMFDLKPTVFMLLHECGHHLSDRLRSERFDDLVKAAICMAFEWIGCGDFIYDPIDTFVSRLNRNTSNEACVQEKNNLLFNLRQDIEDKYNPIIRCAAQEGIKELSDYYGRDVQNQYIAIGADYEFLDELYNNFFGRQVIFYLSEKFIPALFGFINNDNTTDEQMKFYVKQQQKLIENIEKVLGNSFADIAEQMSKDIIQKNGNIREALRLKTIYLDKNLFSKNLFEGGIHIIKEKINNGSLTALYSVFSNVFSDIFAIRILEIEIKEYIKIIPTLLGIEKNEILNDEPSLFRVYIVSKALWGDKVRDNEIESWLRIDDTMKEAFHKRWEMFKNASYLSYLINYAEKCRKKIDKLINKTKQIEDGQHLMYICNMFKGNMDAQINAVFHFCQYLMM